MASIVDLLRNVAGTGATVMLIYNAGSRPGQPRPVIPVSLFKDKLIAFEPGSPVKKVYKLDKIASVELSTGLCAINTQATPPIFLDFPRLDTLAEYVQHFRSELIAAGWHLYEEKVSFGVGTRFKNGKLKKWRISIYYSDPSKQTYYDILGRKRTAKREITGHERPWQTRGRSFAHLDRAFKLFIENVRAMIP